jgi:hypothetical protein
MEKKSHSGYYDIRISNEGKDSYFVEIFSSEKKPKDWEKVEVCIFDTWHDDLIYSTEMESEYLWVRVYSKFGVGSLSFIPIGKNEKGKDFLILHQYTLKPDMKPAIGVFVYPNTEDRIEKTKKHIFSLKKTGIPIFLCSNMECPDDLIRICDGYIYTGPNEMSTVPSEIENKREYLKKSIKYPIKIHPGGFEFYQAHSFINGKGTYLWATAKCIRDSINFLHKEEFTHIMISEGEFFLDDSDSEKPMEILKEMWEEDIVLDFFYTPGSQYLQAYLWFGEISHLKKSLSGISIEEKHFPRKEENSNSSAFVLCEKHYLQKIVSSEPFRKIRIRTVKENENYLRKKYWYTERSEVIFYDDKDFKTGEEKISFPLYFPNSKDFSLSLQKENSRSDYLDSGSFDLDTYQLDEKNWILIVTNKTFSRILRFELIFFDKLGYEIKRQEIKNVLPDLYYFSIFGLTGEEISGCDYKVCIEGENTHFYRNNLIF